MVPLVNNTELNTHLKFANRVDFKCSQHKEKVTMWGDGYVY